MCARAANDISARWPKIVIFILQPRRRRHQRARVKNVHVARKQTGQLYGAQQDVASSKQRARATRATWRLHADEDDDEEAAAAAVCKPRARHAAG